MDNLIFFLLNACVLTICVSTERLEFRSLDGSNFSYTNCYKRTTVPLFVEYLSLEPDPIRFDDNITIAIKFHLDRDIGVSPKKIEVDISFRVRTKTGYTELCDLIGERACHYNDFCATLEEYMEKTKCPPKVPIVYQNNCSCPFRQREYQVRPLTFKLPKLSFEVRGTFAMTIHIQEQGNYLGCVEIQFCIRNCNPLGR